VTDIVLAQAAGPALVGQARELFLEYADAIGTNLEYQGFSAELAALPRPYVPPGGALLLARVDGALAGCVALRPLGETVGEMKRLYVRPDYRKLNLGRRLVEAVIAAARDAGYRELRLDTLPSMVAAQALYRHLGFIEISPYNDTHLPGTRFYSLALTS